MLIEGLAACAATCNKDGLGRTWYHGPEAARRPDQYRDMTNRSG